MIVYPLTDWNTFLDVAQCIVLSDQYITGSKFSALTDVPTQEAILRQTALQMKMCKSIVLPETNETDLQLAQMYLVEHALTVNMMAYDANDKAIASESVDVISVSYFEGLKDGTETFPPMVNTLLSQYGCRSTTGGFKQVPLGRN